MAEIRKLTCARCRRKTNHKEIAKDKLEEDFYGHYDIITRSYMMKCLGCDGVTFLLEVTDYSGNEHVNFDDKTIFEFDENFPHGIYYTATFPSPKAPNKLPKQAPLLGYQKLPAQTRSIYLEAHSAFNAELYQLTGIGLRTLIEAICLDKEVEGKNLHDKIKALPQKRFLSTSMEGALHKIRFIGNDSAHQMDRPSQKDLETAFRIIESLLNTVYILPAESKSIDHHSQNDRKKK